MSESGTSRNKIHCETYVNTATDIESVKSNYLQRNYNCDDESKLTDKDLKLIESIHKINLKYQDAFKNKKYVLLYKKVKPELVVEPVKPKPVFVLCPATKLDGNICNAKLKPGKCYCGRHAKLENVKLE